MNSKFVLVVALLCFCYFSCAGANCQDTAPAENASPTSPTLSPELRKAIDLTNQKKFDQAISLINDYVAKNGPSVDALLVRSVAYYNSHKEREALIDTDDALKLSPQNTRLLFHHFVLMMRKGNMEQALSDADKYAACGGSFPSPFALRAYVYEQNFDWANMVDQCRRGLALNPSDTQFHASLVIAYCRSGFTEPAYKEMKSAYPAEDPVNFQRAIIPSPEALKQAETKWKNKQADPFPFGPWDPTP